MKNLLKLAAMAAAALIPFAILGGALIALMFWGCAKTLKILP